MTHIDPAAKAPVVWLAGYQRRNVWVYAGRIHDWTDADTADVDLLIDVGFEELVTKRRRIRLLGIDAPETRSSDPVEREAGRAAKAYVEQHWPSGTLVEVEVMGFDKYGGRDLGRLRVRGALGDVPTYIGGELLAAGHAVAYDGGAR